MKNSRYNYMIPDAESVIFYNGISDASFRVSVQNAHSIEHILDNPDQYKKDFKVFLEKMAIEGFIIENNVDEDTLIQDKYTRLRKHDVYQFMVLPTYQCNLRCWYCTQNHADSWMSDDIIERIKKRVEKQCSNHEIKIISLMWFGGEPLLAYDKVLELTSWTKHFAETNGKKFYSSITTNGTLLTRKRIDELTEAGVGHYQITIDGDKYTHNSVKKLGNTSAYDITLNNIGYIAEKSHCTIRFNYTHDNLRPNEIMNDLDRILPRNRKNLDFSMYKVWQEEGNLIQGEEVHNLMELAVKAGLRPRLGTIGLCYTDLAHFDCFFANGCVGKCDNIDPSMMTATLHDDGNVEFGELEKEFVTSFDHEESECRSCRYLPACWGPCIAKRTNMLNSDGKIRCQFDNKEQEMAFYLRNEHTNREFATKFNSIKKNDSELTKQPD